MAPTKSWAYGYFKEHPLASKRDPIAYADGEGKKKKKVWCLKCWDYEFHNETNADHAAVQRGERAMPRTEEAIGAVCKVISFTL